MLDILSIRCLHTADKIFSIVITFNKICNCSLKDGGCVYTFSITSMEIAPSQYMLLKFDKSPLLEDTVFCIESKSWLV
jgi:hypothetical protein